MTKLTRSVLENLEKEPLHIARNATKADVYRFEWPPHSGQMVVLKDMRTRPAWFRLTAGRWFLRREWKALRALDGIKGVPRAIAQPDVDSLVMQWLPGTPIMDWGMGQVSAAALERISQILAAVHARGVIHGDLHRSNVLLTPQGEVTLIDWATASVFGVKRSGTKNFTFQEWATLDVRAVAKLKARHRPECLSLRERTALFEGSKTYRFVRTLGFAARKMIGQKRALSVKQAQHRYKDFIEGEQPRSEKSAEEKS